tara:strand:- start:68 stop:403 length:336 start_codon:yes stop_codon:yes gene_type:complete
MPGRNPYSSYLPANSPSLFAETPQEESNLDKILGIGGAGLGLLLGGPAGMKTGMAIGSGVGGLLGGGSAEKKMSSLQQAASALGKRSPDWFADANAKSAAASLMGVELPWG